MGRGLMPKKPSRGMGLQGIRERVAKLGGTVAIDSRQSEGTVLDILIPAWNLRRDWRIRDYEL